MTAAAFQATFADWRLIKGRKVVQVVLEVPLEQSDLAYKVLGGMPDPGKSVWCAVARLQDGKEGDATARAKTRQEPGTIDTPPVQPQDKAGRASPEKRLAQRAGMLCSNVAFQRFIQENYLNWLQRHREITGKDDLEELAADFVRQACGVDSRAEIEFNSNAGSKFDALYSRFIAWRDVPAEVA